MANVQTQTAQFIGSALGMSFAIRVTQTISDAGVKASGAIQLVGKGSSISAAPQAIVFESVHDGDNVFDKATVLSKSYVHVNMTNGQRIPAYCIVELENSSGTGKVSFTAYRESDNTLLVDSGDIQIVYGGVVLNPGVATGTTASV